MTPLTCPDCDQPHATANVVKKRRCQNCFNYYDTMELPVEKAPVVARRIEVIGTIKEFENEDGDVEMRINFWPGKEPKR